MPIQCPCGHQWEVGEGREDSGQLFSAYNNHTAHEPASYIRRGERHNVLSVSIFICTKMDGFFYTLSIMPMLEELLIGQAFIILRLLFPQKRESNLLVKWKNLVHETAPLPFSQVVRTDSSEKGQKKIIAILILLTSVSPFEKAMSHSRKSQGIANVSSRLIGLYFLTKSPKGKTKHFPNSSNDAFVKVRHYKIRIRDYRHIFKRTT